MTGRFRGLRVGLLGGSFNPAHDGHVFISEAARKRLGLDQVWWLVTPQNPLKDPAGLKPFAERLNGARRATARHPKIRATDLEQRLSTRFTADTLKALKRRLPGVRFVWLMGADNLAQIPRWERWQEIFTSVPIAIFDRHPYCYVVLTGIAALRYRHFRLSGRRIAGLVRASPPAWGFLHIRRHPASSTAIRNTVDTPATRAELKAAG